MNITQIWREHRSKQPCSNARISARNSSLELEITELVVSNLPNQVMGIQGYTTYFMFAYQSKQILKEQASNFKVFLN